MRYPVAFTWIQPEVWDWAANPGPGLRMRSTTAVDGIPWPRTPSDWRPGHRVYNLSLLPDRDTVLTFGWRGPGLELEAMVPWRTPDSVPVGMLRRALQWTVAGRGLEDAMKPDFLQSKNEVDRSYTTYRWPYGSPDREEDPLLPTDARLAFDPTDPASRNEWRLELLLVGSCSFVQDDWHVKMDLPTRTVSDGKVDLKVDPGGFVRGPGVDREWTEEQQRDWTTRLLQRWGAPAPTFRGLAMQVAWPDPWGPEHSILRGLGSDRWGGPGVW